MRNSSTSDCDDSQICNRLPAWRRHSLFPSQIVWVSFIKLFSSWKLCTKFNELSVVTEGLSEKIYIKAASPNRKSVGVDCIEEMKLIALFFVLSVASLGELKFIFIFINKFLFIGECTLKCFEVTTTTQKPHYCPACSLLSSGEDCSCVTLLGQAKFFQYTKSNADQSGCCMDMNVS